MGLKEYHEGKKGAFLHQAFKEKVKWFQRVRLIMVVYIDNIAYLDKKTLGVPTQFYSCYLLDVPRYALCMGTIYYCTNVS